MTNDHVFPRITHHPKILRDAKLKEHFHHGMFNAKIQQGMEKLEALLK
ncbi:hypothetical protein [Nostoc sp.]